MKLLISQTRISMFLRYYEPLVFDAMQYSSYSWNNFKKFRNNLVYKISIIATKLSSQYSLHLNLAFELTQLKADFKVDVVIDSTLELTKQFKPHVRHLQHSETWKKYSYRGFKMQLKWIHTWPLQSFRQDYWPSFSHYACSSEILV